MEYVPAQNTEEDFQGFLKLDNEWDQYYVALGVGGQYDRVPFNEQSDADKRAEFEDHLAKDVFFLFAKDGPGYEGYIFGKTEGNNYSYKVRRVGYLDSIIVAKKYRGQGISSTMRDLFFDWLRQQNITVCWIRVKEKNQNAVNIYKNGDLRLTNCASGKRYKLMLL